jgi:hypothetical protein
VDPYSVLPNKLIEKAGPVSKTFLNLGIRDFHGGCRYVHGLPYGYNSNRDDLMTLFEEKMGSCTTKHAVIATLAAELKLDVVKHIGIYAMTEALVSGTQKILNTYGLPYVPMIHCFLVYEAFSIDLTEGNRNGKNGPIDHFFFTAKVTPNISGKEEYLLYRKALADHILQRKELAGVSMKIILKAREEGLALLRENIGC